MPLGMDTDVVIYSSVGPHVSTWDDSRPLGGTEKGLLVLKRALEGRGVKVLLEGPPANGMPSFKTTRSMIVNRWSEVPRWIDVRRLVHFVGDKEPERMGRLPGAKNVFVSEWQHQRANHVPGDKTIYPLLDDNLYELAALDLPKVPGRWIYASSFQKGLPATMAMWTQQRPAGAKELVVTNTYHDEPTKMLSSDDVRWLGIRTPYQLAREIATSEGMFFYNTYEECFPVTVAIAKLMRCKAILGCVSHEPCGAHEAARVTLDKEFQTDQWMGVLGL